MMILNLENENLKEKFYKISQTKFFFQNIMIFYKKKYLLKKQRTGPKTWSIHNKFK